MRFDEYREVDATGLAEVLRRGDMTPSEVARIAAEAIAAANPRLAGVIEVFEDLLGDPTRDGMDPSGVFAGVPMLLKDIGSTIAGRRQAQGIAWLAEFVAEQTDPLVGNFHRAGLNVIGRSTCPELGLSFDTSSPGFGITRNPWNLDYTPGGSSGGSAACVAAGLVPIASASDGGGSTRFPAGWTGLLGLKPTRGLLPMPTHASEASLYPAVEGVLTRSVRDMALAYDQMWSKAMGWGFVDYGDPGWGEPGASLSSQLDAPPRQFRIALSTGAWGFPDHAIDGSVVDRILETARALEALGHDVVQVKDTDLCDFALLWQSYRNWGWMIPCSEALAELAALVGADPAPADSSPQLLNHLALAGSASAADVFGALAANAEVSQQWGRFWQSGFDLLLCPVAAIVCPGAGKQYSTLEPGPLEEWFGRLETAARFTVPGNETGLPSISLPAGLDRNGLPVGAQIYAPWRHEHDLVHVAAQLEQAAPEHFASRPPFEIA